MWGYGVRANAWSNAYMPRADEDVKLKAETDRVLEVVANEAVRMCADEIVTGTIGRRPDTGEFVYQQHTDCGFFTQADAESSGDFRYEMAGRAPQNEQGVREVCITLAQVLSNEEDVNWTADALRTEGLDIWTDWVVRNGPIALPVQVTRVALQHRWGMLGAGGRVDGIASASDAAAEMWAAIQRKLPQQDDRTLLALDIRHPGFHGFPAALNEFRRVYGIHMERQVRFCQVWAVGYAPELTHLLYRRR